MCSVFAKMAFIGIRFTWINDITPSFLANRGCRGTPCHGISDLTHAGSNQLGKANATPKVAQPKWLRIIHMWIHVFCKYNDYSIYIYIIIVIERLRDEPVVALVLILSPYG